MAALRVVDAAFEHRLADPLRHAALHLALQQQRVDDHAEIVDDEIAQDRDMPGLGVDLDLADMAAIGKGRRRRA